MRLQLITSWRRTPLPWRFDFHCVRRGGTWPHLGVADLASEKSRVHHDAADERRCQHRDQRGACRYRLPSPTHQPAQSEYAESTAKEVRLVAHLLMGVYVLTANSRESAYRLLRCVAA